MATHSLRQRVVLYLACYTIWLVISAMAGWLIFALRPLLFRLGVWLQFNPWQVRALDNFSIVGMGLVWLIFILVLEHMLREGVEKNRLWSRAARAFVVVAIPLGLCYALLALLAIQP